MSFSDRKVSSAFKAYFIDASGTVDISADYRSFDFDSSIDTVDASAGADTARGMKGTLKVYGATLEAIYTGTAGTALQARLQEGDEGTLRWAPLGTAAGLPKGELPAIVKSANMSFPYDDLITVTYVFEPQGALASDPRSATF